MDKKRAQTLIEETFNDSFNEERFAVFAKNLLNDFEDKNNHYSGNLIWDDYKEHINTYKRIGKYIDPDGEALDVLIVEVKNVNKLERARTALRNFVIKHLSKFEKDYALVAFYSKEDEGKDWRFSFIKLEYRSELDEEKGKVKTKKEFTPAKRYSFLVGKYEKAHTAKNQLLPLLQNISNNPTIEELEAAFSIEKVTDEFFNQYKDLYIKLYEHFENDSNVKAAINQAGIDNARFTKKLLGQIVFLYFLQKKGWLGVAQNERWGKGNKRFVQELFELAQTENENFFKDKLQYLFYEALAKERDNENSYYKRFDCRIPFLNGGLFEADYDWQNTNIIIPENLFRNEEKNKSGDVGTGVLDVFDRYNFTIKEDEPLDKEVAVDPEMLGKVFENMLEIKERKSKGAFYTPREIVHYMCQESLIHYLDNALEGKIKKDEIEEFVRQGHSYLENDINAKNKIIKILAGEQKTSTSDFKTPESIRINADLIDQKLSNIKICDPAIGSGAFPVGLLHEILISQQLAGVFFTEGYRKLKLNKLKIEEFNEVTDSRYIYRLKRHIIQESIYGVDIDSSAIDIARLRLWLSLVVDEDDLDPIETLPNLDYKIVAGNSLIGLPAQGADRYPQLSQELEELKEMFYDETDEVEKKKLRKQINSKIQTVLKAAEDFEGYKIDFDFKLFFSEVWREKGGFDVVIGNPPYGAELNENDKSLLKNRFSKIVERIRNSYLYFIGVSEELLNKSGNVTIIIPNEFLFQVYMSKARAYYLRQCRMLKAINIGEDAFKAIVPTCIVMFDKIKDELDYKFDIWDFRFNKLNEIEIKLKNKDLKKISRSSILNTPNYTYSFNPERSLIVNRLSEECDKFEDFCDDIANGVCTSHDKVYIVSQNLIVSNYFEDKYVKPTLKGKDIKKFFLPKEPPNYILYIDKDFELNRNPNIVKYLEKHKDELIQKSIEKKKGIRPWHILFRSRSPELFEAPKILFRQTGDSIICALDRLGYFSINSTNIGKLKSHAMSISLALTAVLNSEVVNFFYREISQEGGRVLAEVKPTRLRALPIAKHLKLYSRILGNIVQYLENLNGNKTDLCFSFFLQLNNAVSFELYFPEEIKSAGKEILNHLGDLKPITEDMSEEEKLATIQKEFERLYDPNHPVRFAIETLDSVEEVRIIKEALK